MWRRLVQNQSAQLARLTAGQQERPSALQQDQNGLTGTLLIGKALFKTPGLITLVESYVFPYVEEKGHVVKMLIGLN